jgi:NAD(P)-dependent dehydrogenase (short-subunit alcohol dehydrogenase family)
MPKNILERFRLDGRVALVTGAGQGIGEALAHALAQAGANVAVIDINKTSLTKSLAAEWADRGVRVNCISPGILRTKLILESPVLAQLVDHWIQNIPMGRLCELDDLTGAAVFLASEVSDYMTGHNLVVEGGQTLW